MRLPSALLRPARPSALLLTLCLASGGATAAAVWKGPGWMALADTASPVSTQPYKASVKGQAWYIDAEAGSDSAPGSLRQPWKTLERARRVSLRPGDALLLKCGSVWRESLVLSQHQAPQGQVLIGAYGDCSLGQRPRILASDRDDGRDWRPADPQRPGLYTKDRFGKVDQLFFQGQRLVQARYPDARGPGQEFALADGVGKPNQFRVRAADLARLRGHDLKGAAIHVRAVAWQIESAQVSNFDPQSGLITLSKNLSTPIRPGTGYILEGQGWMLNAPGEWLHDARASKLYVLAPGGQRPQAGDLELGVRDKAIVAHGVKQLSIEFIEVGHASESGLSFTEVPEVQVSRVKSVHAGRFGIAIHEAPEALVQGSEVEAAGWIGLSVRKSPGLRLSRNHVKDTGLGGRPQMPDAAISAEGARASITDNLVERAANPGIRFFNLPGTVVRGNTVISPCIRATDCGGIYTWTSDKPALAATRFEVRAMVENNVVLGARSNLEGVGGPLKNMAAGIYLDEMSAGVTVRNNTVAGSELGIYLHNAQFNVITGNTVHSASSASFSANATRPQAEVIRGNRIQRNTFSSRRAVGAQEDSYAYRWSSTGDPNAFFRGQDANTIEDNQIVAYSGKGQTQWLLAQGGHQLKVSTAGWRAMAPRDAEAVPPQAGSQQAVRLKTSGPSLIGNGEFKAGTQGWRAYFNPKGKGGSLKRVTAAPCPGSCLQFVAGSSSDLLYSAPFRLDSTPGKNRYVLRYTAIGGRAGGLSGAVIRRDGPPYEDFGLQQAGSPLAPGERRQEEIVFEATNNEPGRLDFLGRAQSDTLISQVSLFKVEGADANPTSQPLDLVNLGAEPRKVDCRSLGLAHCQWTSPSGKAVAWPLTLPARQSVLLLPATGQ